MKWEAAGWPGWAQAAGVRGACGFCLPLICSPLGTVPLLSFGKPFLLYSTCGVCSIFMGKSVKAWVGVRWPGLVGSALAECLGVEPLEPGPRFKSWPLHLLTSNKFCSFSVFSFFICNMGLVVTFVSYIYCTIHTVCTYSLRTRADVTNSKYRLRCSGTYFVFM